MTYLQLAAQEILKLWKSGDISATCHSGATPRVVDSMQNLEVALARETSKTIEQYVEELTK